VPPARGSASRALKALCCRPPISANARAQKRLLPAGECCPSVDQHRRARTAPLTNEEKRARVEAELKADPARSDRTIADAAGVHNTFVGRVRKRIDHQGVQLSSTPSFERRSVNGKVGEGQRLPRCHLYSAVTGAV